MSMPIDAPERQKITGEVSIPAQLAKEVLGEVQNITQLQVKLNEAQSEGVSRIFAVLLVSTLPLDASDIHVEAKEEGAKIRLRIDGLLQDVIEFSRETYEELLSRIKLVSGLKLNVADKPQDGRFSIVFEQGQPIEARVATLPAEYGEAVVLRVLNPRNLMALKDLNLREDLLQLFRQELKKPNGMILATGPTGCGKTTTLYAFLKEISSKAIKVVTIEDPIEYHLEGISQTQVHPERGYDFASGLQAIVRQDPDVILVGEIRDESTAQIALQAALTGHMVLSTLHTNDAPGTVSRLISLGAKPISIAAASNLMIGQRLVRRVCKKCAGYSLASASQRLAFKKGLKGIPPQLQPKMTTSLKIAKAQKCEDCNLTGYKGRVGLFEAIVVDQKMEEHILTNPSLSALRQFAIKRGMITMYQDGLIKVMEGITTLEEIERVTGEYV